MMTRTQYETDAEKIREAIRSGNDVIYYEHANGKATFKHNQHVSEDCERITNLHICREIKHLL